MAPYAGIFRLGSFKGFATAKDNRGWFHIDRKGIPIYAARYLSVEPFYNGMALGTTHQNEKILIDETGHKVRNLEL
ncbi:MAG: hypothetical protein ACUVRD_09205 [Bacteroidia bacterium]